jgi:hypothetical protein
MLKEALLDLCKKVKNVFPKETDPPAVEKPLQKVSLFRCLVRYINSAIHMEKKNPKVISLVNGKRDKEAAHVHQCSLDSRHHHLMIHGEALALRMMKKKKVFASNPSENRVANHHLKRLEYINGSLKFRSVIQVRLDMPPEEPPIDYQYPNQSSASRHCIITRVNRL